MLERQIGALKFCQAKEILLYPDTNLCHFTGGQTNPLVMLSRVFIPLCPTTDNESQSAGRQNFKHSIAIYSRACAQTSVLL